MVLPVPIILCKACKVPPDEENCLNGFSMLIAAGMPVRCALIAALVTTTDDHFVLPGPLQLAHRERCRAARLRSAQRHVCQFPLLTWLFLSANARNARRKIA